MVCEVMGMGWREDREYLRRVAQRRIRLLRIIHDYCDPLKYEDLLELLDAETSKLSYEEAICLMQALCEAYDRVWDDLHFEYQDAIRCYAEQMTEVRDQMEMDLIQLQFDADEDDKYWFESVDSVDQAAETILFLGDLGQKFLTEEELERMLNPDPYY